MKIVSLKKMSLFLLVPIFYANAAPIDYNPIDAVTSASTRLKIIGGHAYANSAQITWWDFYSNGDQQVLKYGTSTAYGATINLKPFTEQTDITTTIPNLLSNTTYYYQFFRLYSEQAIVTNGSFTTFGNGGIRQTKPNAALAVDLRDKTIEVYLPSGKLVASRANRGAQAKTASGYSLLQNLDLKSGSYLFMVIDSKSGRIISRSKQAVIR